MAYIKYKNFTGVEENRFNNLNQYSSPTKVGYSLGHFLSGTNVLNWFEYSGVNAARLFITMSDIALEPITIPSSREELSTAINNTRNSFNSNNIFNWTLFSNNIRSLTGDRTASDSGNKIDLIYALKNLNKLNVSIFINANASNNVFPLTSTTIDTEDWAGVLKLWQNYYALSYILAKDYNIVNYSIYNEPDTFNIPVSAWFYKLQICSNAIQTAIKDINVTRGVDNLIPNIYAPNTAGNGSDNYTKTYGQSAHNNILTSNVLNLPLPNLPQVTYQTYNYQKYSQYTSNTTSNSGYIDDIVSLSDLLTNNDSALYLSNTFSNISGKWNYFNTGFETYWVYGDNAISWWTILNDDVPNEYVPCWAIYCDSSILPTESRVYWINRYKDMRQEGWINNPKYSVSYPIPTVTPAGQYGKIALTEFNVRTSSNYDNRPNTLDYPEDFCNLAANCAALVANSAKDMFLFKFGQTRSDDNSVYPVVKNGTFYVSNSGDFNYGSATKGAEVYRLFTKGVKNATKIINSTYKDGVSSTILTYNSNNSNYYLFAVNKTGKPLQLDTIYYSVPYNNYNVACVYTEEVSPTCSGSITNFVSKESFNTLLMPPSSVWLVNIPLNNLYQSSIIASSDTTLGDGINRFDYGDVEVLSARDDGVSLDNRKVSLIKFTGLGAYNKDSIQSAVLSMNTRSSRIAERKNINLDGVTTHVSRIVYGNGIYVAVRNNFINFNSPAYYSYDGLKWIPVEIGIDGRPFGEYVHDVVFNDDLKLFVAVTDIAGTTKRFYTSKNGIIWTYIGQRAISTSSQSKASLVYGKCNGIGYYVMHRESDTSWTYTTAVWSFTHNDIVNNLPISLFSLQNKPYSNLVYGNGCFAIGRIDTITQSDLINGLGTYAFSTNPKTQWNFANYAYVFNIQYSPLMFNDGMFTVLSNSQRLRFSTDGINWTSLSVTFPNAIGGSINSSYTGCFFKKHSFIVASENYVGALHYNGSTIDYTEYHDLFSNFFSLGNRYRMYPAGKFLYATYPSNDNGDYNSCVVTNSAIQAHLYGLDDNNWATFSTAWVSAGNFIKQNVPVGNLISNNYITPDNTKVLGQINTAANFPLIGDKCYFDVTNYIKTKGGTASFLIAQDHRWDVNVDYITSRSLSSGDTQPAGLEVYSRYFTADAPYLTVNLATKPIIKLKNIPAPAPVPSQAIGKYNLQNIIGNTSNQVFGIPATSNIEMTPLSADTGLTVIASVYGLKTRSYNTGGTSIAASLLNKDTYNFSVKAKTTSTAINSITGIVVSSTTSGPRNVALVYNTTNNWNQFTIIFDRTISKNVDILLDSDINAFFRNKSLAISPGQTYYFKLVPYRTVSVNGEFSIRKIKPSNEPDIGLDYRSINTYVPLNEPTVLFDLGKNITAGQYFIRGQTNTTRSTISAENVNRKVVLTSISAHEGMTVDSSSSGWRYRGFSTTSSTITAALEKAEFFHFAITPNTTFNSSFQVTDIQNIGVRSNNNGPTKVALLYNETNNWTQYKVIFDSSITTNTEYIFNTSSWFSQNPITLVPYISGFYRLVPYASNSASGYFTLLNGSTWGQNYINILGNYSPLAQGTIIPNDFISPSFDINTVTVTSDVAYKTVYNANNNLITLGADFYSSPDFPSDRRRPLVIQLHGGGFTTAQNKANQQYTTDACKEWASRGFLAVAPEYRRRVQSTATRINNDIDGVLAMKEAVIDIVDFVAWVKTQSAVYNFDPNFIFIVGGSAGGIITANVVRHIGTVAATPDSGSSNPARDVTFDQTGIIGCVNWWGSPFYVTLNPNLSTSKFPERPPYNGDYRWYGQGQYTRAEILAATETDPPSAGPGSMINDNIPTLIIHGEGDEVNPFLCAQKYESQLKQVNNPVDLLYYPNAGHKLSDPEDYPGVLINTANFFSRVLYSKFTKATIYI